MRPDIISYWFMIDIPVTYSYVWNIILNEVIAKSLMTENLLKMPLFVNKNIKAHTHRCFGEVRISLTHDDVIKWKHFPRYWPFVRGIHRSPVNSLHKGQWRGALMFTLICARINGWINNRKAGDLKRNRAHYDVIVMMWFEEQLINMTDIIKYNFITWKWCNI